MSGIDRRTLIGSRGKLADATDVTTTGAALGKVPGVTQVSPLTFGLKSVSELINGGHQPWHLDSYRTFFTEGWTWVVGQGTASTTLTAAASTGATTLAVASGTGLINGVILVVAAGTAQQKQHQITAGGGTTSLTITPALANPLASGATITPLWTDNGHLTNPAGWSSLVYWLMSRTRPDGTRVIGDPGATKPIVFFGNSWMVPALSSAYTAAVQNVYPAAVVQMNGVSGNNSAQLLARFDTDVPTNAAYVVFNEPGVNSVGSSESRAVRQANLEAIIAKCRAIGAVPVYLGAAPLQQYPAGSKALSVEMAEAFSDPALFPLVSLSALDERYQQKTASGSTAYGAGALASDTNGSNTGFGQGALGANVGGSANVAVGQYALSASTGNGNTAIGQGTLQSTTSNENTAVGQSAAQAVTSGANNTAVGSNALLATATGQHNTAIGRQALKANTGTANTAVGRDAAAKVTSGGGNVVIGVSAAESPNFNGANGTTTANNQTLVGAYSGQSSPSQVDEVVAVGTGALVGGKGAIAIGSGVTATAAGSFAIGRDSSDGKAASTLADRGVLGTAAHTVQVPGRFNVAPRTPTATADSQGTAGDIAADDNFVYVKTSTGWKRSALTTF